MRDSLEKLKSARVKFILALGGVFLLIAARCFQLQILQREKYLNLAERNRTLVFPVKAPRGLITDREGRVLAETRASFSLSFVRGLSRDTDSALSRVSHILSIPVQELRHRLENYRDYPEMLPVVIAENLTMAQVSELEAIRDRFPELLVEAEPMRFYPFGELAAHVVGYVGEANRREVESMELKPGTMVGKKGVERFYDKVLRGKDGALYLLRDSMGNPIKIIKRTPPHPGKKLVLTLDLKIQRWAREELKGKSGVVVVLSPKTGEVLAMVSSPSFDPNLMSSRFAGKAKLKIMTDPGKPLFNRAIQGTYPIGSIFKLAMAVAALKKGVVKPKERIFCPGFFPFGGRNFRCWKPGGHGWEDLAHAIRDSCNVYFYKMGDRLGIENIVDVVKEFPFGRKTGIDLPGEKEGILPSPQWKRKHLGVDWYPGETISLSIGQGYFTATPLQVATFASAIGNRGWYPVPHVLRGRKTEKVKLNISPWIFEEVIKGMRLVVKEGTGRAASVPGVSVCGKTGTAQVVKLEKSKEIKPHSLFAAFAPCDNPEVSIFVLVEHGGAGGEAAAPVAGRLLRRIFGEKIKGN